MPDGWRRTSAFERAVAVTALLTLLAVLTRRVDLVVLAAPFAVGTVLALAARPSDPPDARMSPAAGAALEGDTVPAVVTVTTPADADTGGPWLDVVAVTLRHSAGVRPPGWSDAAVGAGYSGRVISLAPEETVDLPLPLLVSRWGRAPIGPVEVNATAAQGMFAAGPLVLPPVYLPVWPLREAFGATDTVPHALGMVGQHRSRRPGEGTDIAEVRPFQPGDRLRRVNWRVSSRAGRLHVTSTLSDRDTELALCLDSSHELRGAEVTSLDLAVRAGAAIGEHYLRAGDRVGLVDLGQPMRRVRPGAGRRHLVRLLDVLLDVRADRRSDDFGAAVALAELPPGALVVVLSPLVGDVVFGTVARLARGGRSVVVVDTLPDDAGPDEYGSWTLLAWRLWRLDRDNGVGRLAELGVPVVPWRAGGSLDQVLRDVSRAARAPRAAR